MEAKIELIQGNQLDLNELANWINDEKIEELEVKKESVPDENNLGGIDIAILVFYLSVPVLKEVVALISAWVSERKPKAKVKFTDKKSGKSIEIDAESIKNLDQLIESFVRKIK